MLNTTKYNIIFLFLWVYTIMYSYIILTPAFFSEEPEVPTQIYGYYVMPAVASTMVITVFYVCTSIVFLS